VRVAENRDFPAIRFSRVFGLLSQVQRFFPPSQALTGDPPPGGEADVQVHVSFLWTAPLMGAPAVHDLAPHDLASSGQWGGGLARTACFKNSLLQEQLGFETSSQRPAMKTFFLRFFTWWNGQTFGTQLWTWRFGEAVGSDEFGNRYYRTAGGKIDPVLLMERRWVIYNGEAEASSVPPSWHGWLHHTVDVPPTEEKYQARPWQKPHRPNLTGTPAAHRPTGSTLAQGRRPKATGDYKAWNPGR
jgi:NADH:ubiquinone oxidoreductase subunit